MHLPKFAHLWGSKVTTAALLPGRGSKARSAIEDCPTFCEGGDNDLVLFQAALAAKWKEPPRDALDTMILSTSGKDLSVCDVLTQVCVRGVFVWID